MKATNLTLVFVALLATHLNFAQVGVGTILPEPSSVLDISANDKGLLAPRVSLDNVTTDVLDGVNNAADGLLIWNTNPTTIGGNGVGFYFYNGADWERLSSAEVDTENGLSITGSTVRLGGSLNQATSIISGANDFTLNLSSTGDFNIQDNGITHFQVRDNGNSYFGGEVRVHENSVAGTTIARLFDIAGQDGALYLYSNGSAQHRLDAGFETVFNDLGSNLDFRIESNTNPFAFGINAGEDVMFAGTSTVSLTNNGATVNGVTVEYVASFYRDDLTNGTAVQMGSTEYITDFGNLIWGPYGTWAPYSDNTFDLGTNTFRWDDVYATAGTVNTSDIRLKKNIKNLDYGLAEVMKLQPISYQWKKSLDPSEVKIGFSAQQLLDVLPEVVKTHDFVYPDENGPGVLKENETLGVYYSDIIPVLTKAIQEQQAIIDRLLQRVSTLENHNE